MTKRPGTIWQEHRDAAAAFRAEQNENTWTAYVLAHAALVNATEEAWDAYLAAREANDSGAIQDTLAVWRELVTGDAVIYCDECGDGARDCLECDDCGDVGCECVVTDKRTDCANDDDSPYCPEHAPSCGIGCPRCDPDYYFDLRYSY